MKEYAGAEADYSRVIELESDNAEAFCNRGETRFNLKRWSEAIAGYSRAIDLNPRWVEACCGRGHAYAMQERWREALADFEKAIELDPQGHRPKLEAKLKWVRSKLPAGD